MKRKTGLPVLLLIILLPVYSLGQINPRQIDSLKSLLAIASSDSARGSLSAELALGYRFSNVDSSLFYTDISLQYARRANQLKSQALLLSLKGATLLEAGRLPESLQLQFEALKITDEIKDTSTKAFALNRIGNTYMELGDYKMANKYYFMSMNLFEKLANTGMYDNEMSNIGNIYELMQRPDSALYYQEIVFKHSLQTDNRKSYVRPEIMFRLGNIYRQKKEYEKAMGYYKKGVEEAYIDNDIRNLTMNTLLIAFLYSEMKQTDSSIAYATRALETGGLVSFKKGMYEAAMLLSKLFESKRQPDSAYKYLLRANSEKESLTGTTRLQELQNVLLQEQESRRVSEVERIAFVNRQKQYALFGGLIVFLIIASLLYRNNRHKQKANKILESTLVNLTTTQTQLIQSEKMASLGELTAGIAHEIQNPLNFVNNFSEINSELIDELNEKLEMGNEQLAIGNLQLVSANMQSAKEISQNLKENEEKVTNHGKRADAIVKSMLQHSRSSNGQKAPTDINLLADEYLRLAYHGLRAKDKSFNAELITDFDLAIEKVNMIPQEIGRVLLNLLNNAFYAVSESKRRNQAFNPTVSISTKKTNDKIIISVSDNGNGIPESIKEKIFQPFFTTKSTGEGTGLGLSLSYDIVTKGHGGELKVETKEGEGSSFIIQLPSNI